MNKELSAETRAEMARIEEKLEVRREWQRMAVLPKGMKGYWFGVKVAQYCECLRTDVTDRKGKSIELRVKARLQDLDIKVAVPMHTISTVRRGRIQKKRQPVLPNYVFVCTPGDIPGLIAIQEINGVVELVRDLHGPRRISEDHMLAFSELAEDGVLDVRVKPKEKLKPGDRVRFTDGPFEDFQAVVMADPENRIVLLEALLFGAERQIKVAEEKIKKVDETPLEGLKRA